jgi:hypothetical protein
MTKQGLPKITAKTFDKPEVQETSTPTPKITVTVVAVNVPYCESSDSSGYQSPRCDLGRLSSEQSRKLNAIRRGYDYSGTKLANGGEVKSMADAMKALLDSIEM